MCRFGECVVFKVSFLTVNLLSIFHRRENYPNWNMRNGCLLHPLYLSQKEAFFKQNDGLLVRTNWNDFELVAHTKALSHSKWYNRGQLIFINQLKKIRFFKRKRAPTFYWYFIQAVFFIEFRSNIIQSA